MSATIDILLATYNGEKYIAEQLDSLFSQDFTDWHLFIRDDGSSDDTLLLINKYIEENPTQITMIEDALGNVGPARCFSLLMQKSVAPYVAFCDQDDVWVTNKLSMQLLIMQEQEEIYTSDFPLLVHSDLFVVDDQLTVFADSLWGHQKLSPVNMSEINHLLVQNFVTGCTCLLNRKLVDITNKVPETVIMHDWWIALVVILKGKIISIPVSTVKYRQHEDNDTGAINWSAKYVYNQVCNGMDALRFGLQKTRVQANALLEADFLSVDDRKLIKLYVDMFKQGWFKRRYIMIRYKFTKNGFLRNLAMFVVL